MCATAFCFAIEGDTDERLQLEDPLPTLEDWGVKSLYTPPEVTSTHTKKYEDHAFILKRMAKSLLLNFLELVGIMSCNPAEVCLPLDYYSGNVLMELAQTVSRED